MQTRARRSGTSICFCKPRPAIPYSCVLVCAAQFGSIGVRHTNGARTGLPPRPALPQPPHSTGAAAAAARYDNKESGESEDEDQVQPRPTTQCFALTEHIKFGGCV